MQQEPGGSRASPPISGQLVSCEAFPGSCHFLLTLTNEQGVLDGADGLDGAVECPDGRRSFGLYSDQAQQSHCSPGKTGNV